MTPFFYLQMETPPPYDGEANVSASANSVTALFSDADGDSMNYSLNSARVKKVSDGSTVSSEHLFSTDTITASVTLECGTSYYWEIDAGSITDINGASSIQANKTSNPKLFLVRTFARTMLQY